MRFESLDDRKQQVLATVVQAHIETGAPVPSSVVARRLQQPISSATVRHEMAELEQMGYLQQPHTSAGRLPLAGAYEFYVNRVAATARLTPADRKWIERRLLASDDDGEGLWVRAPHVLAELCHGVGLLLATPLHRTALDQVRFVVLDGQRVLVVVVTRTGLVRDKVVHTREPLRPEQLERMGDYVNQQFRGWTLEAIRAEIERRVAAERSAFLQRALELCCQGFASEEGGALHVEGVAQLVEEVEAANPGALRGLLHALEEKERLARLLSDCLASPDQPLGIRVGLEQLSPAMKDFTLIAARPLRGDGPFGSLGLLGRTRMDYSRAVTAVTYLAALVDHMGAEN